jgi:hypothetical protein
MLIFHKELTELFVHVGWSAKNIYGMKCFKTCGEKLLADSESFFKFRKKTSVMYDR